ncbi:MAG: N-acetyl-gamma-glutamyl-phosphate reductase [Ignavibacteriae bacterium]|nr:N-acetyl-gamma-glutamyl-phosphate reductase [Ignavibacteriota bacterium]
MQVIFIAINHRCSLIRAAVIGASGYSGAELLRLLSLREDVQIQVVTAKNSVGKKVNEVYPVFSGAIDLEFESFLPENLSQVDVAFVALPSGEAMHVVPRLLPVVDRVIDLGGDFRLPSASLYTEFYKHEHTAADLLGEAVYGLPELNHDAIASACLVANPGCYPTSAILALLPALQHGVIERTGIVINSLSGVSGAGRNSSVELSFTEVNENIRAYKIASHQHIPEIQTILEQVAGASIALSFVPHLIPITRGIYTTIHADLHGSFTEAEVYDLYETFYANAPFVRIRREIPQIRDVVRTNYCDVHLTIEPRTRQLILISAIDNLVKGAAGQAIQNMNIMFGCPQERGLC